MRELTQNKMKSTEKSLRVGFLSLFEFHSKPSFYSCDYSLSKIGVQLDQKSSKSRAVFSCFRVFRSVICCAQGNSGERSA
jgi:hypothetical protein